MERALTAAGVCVPETGLLTVRGHHCGAHLSLTSFIHIWQTGGKRFRPFSLIQPSKRHSHWTTAVHVCSGSTAESSRGGWGSQMLPQTQETIFKSLHALFVKESVVPLSALISPPQSLQHREWHNDKKGERGRQWGSWLVFRPFGPMQEDVKSPLISNPSLCISACSCAHSFYLI